MQKLYESFGWVLSVDQLEPKKDGSAREFTLEKMDSIITFYNRPQTTAQILREMADRLDQLQTSKQGG